MTVTAESGPRRLYKSRTQRMIDGVCGGVAEYLGLDPTLVRIAWVVLALLGGSGILLYVIAMIIIPPEPAPSAASMLQSAGQPAGTGEKFLGILLILAGTLWLMGNLGFPVWGHWWRSSWELVFPVLLILAGIAFLWRRKRDTSDTASTDDRTTDRRRRLLRSRYERKLFGVCGGLGDYFDLDPTIVRLLFAVSALASFGLTVVLYIVLAIVVPEDRMIPVS